MHAVVVERPGGPEVLTWAAVPDPVPGPGEVLVAVAASAVNRADLLQRQGHYPPPPGASSILGLECSGTIAAVGPDVAGWQVGQPVCALLAGGGYAELVAVPIEQLLPVPDPVELVDAAGLPEACCTVWSNVFQLAGLRSGELLLVHGGAGGVGTVALQLGRRHGARVVCTARANRLADCRALGAELAVDYAADDFVTRVRELSGGRGADVVLDNMGATYLARNVDVLAPGGRLVVIGLQGGRRGELDIGLLLAKRATVHATTLRVRPAAEKAAIVQGVREHVWPAIAAAELRPVVHARVPMTGAAEAHRLVEQGGHLGKVLLTLP
jgi:putative PIG3 family NAD(P)H quinone oxidoreductase